MKRLAALAIALCISAPALAADWPITANDADRSAGYRCVIIETFYPTYPAWISSPDPFNIVIPQYYSDYSWVCGREKLNHARAFRRHGRPDA